MQEPPGLGADVVEELQGSGCLFAMRGLGEAEDPEVTMPAPAPAFGTQIPGLLVRLRRPSVVPSTWSLVGRLKGCDHADGPPAACFRAGRGALIAPPGGARYDIVRGASLCRGAPPAQCQTPHPEGRPLHLFKGRPPFRCRVLPFSLLPMTPVGTSFRACLRAGGSSSPWRWGLSSRSLGDLPPGRTSSPRHL